MFPDADPGISGPHVFYVPPGADFPGAVLRGFEERMPEADPTAWARVRLVANSGRMLARLRDEFEAGPPRLLPQMGLMTDIDGLAPDTLLSPNEPLHPLRIKLDLARLLLNAPGLSNRATAFDMAGSLATLFAEMDEEG
ncbi:MAG: double-strand break repair protein AddB, partial [Pseudomonadota bacterium]